MAKWENFNTNPDLNTASPPIGAPNGQRAETLNDCIRYVMAAVKELGNELRTGNAAGDGDAGTDALGSMAYQDADAVAITGGTISIGSGNGISGESIRSGTVSNTRLPVVTEAVRAQRIVTGPSTSLDIQDIYNTFFPVNYVMLKDTGLDSLSSLPTAPTGVVAVWERIDTTRYLRFKSAGDTPPRIGGSFSGTTAAGGTHTHGGFTGQAENAGSGGYGFDSGGPVHRHSISDTGTSHTHEFTVFPSYLSLSGFRRVS